MRVRSAIKEILFPTCLNSLLLRISHQPQAKDYRPQCLKNQVCYPSRPLRKITPTKSMDKTLINHSEGKERTIITEKISWWI